MLKKLFFCCAFFAIIGIMCVSISALSVSAEHAVLIEAQSGDVIYSKCENTRAPMASTTKIMTAIIVIENAELDEIVKIPLEAVGVEGSSIYLKEGEELSVRELLYALLLSSANDASVALAIHTSGDVDTFADMMNEKARELGLINTHFTNPHGLDNEEHYTTAYELAMIARYAMQNPIFREIVSTTKEIIPSSENSVRVLINHNKLLNRYEGTIGIKTGFTRKSGRCLVSCAERDGAILIAVTLNAPTDWHDHKQMLDLGFGEYESITLANVGDYTIALNCINGQSDEVLCSNLSSLSITLKRGQAENINAVLETKRFLFAPVNQGDSVGQISYYLDDEKIASVELYTIESVKNINYKKSIFERIFG